MRIWLKLDFPKSLNTSWPSPVHAWSCQALEQEPQRQEFVSIDEHAQALREAEARGMERAAEMTWVSGDANECCQELFEQHQYNLRAEVKKCTGTDSGAK